MTESPDALIIAETTSVGFADPAVDCAGVARNLRFNGMSCRKDPTQCGVSGSAARLSVDGTRRDVSVDQTRSKRVTGRGRQRR